MTRLLLAGAVLAAVMTVPEHDGQVARFVEAINKREYMKRSTQAMVSVVLALVCAP